MNNTSNDQTYIHKLMSARPNQQFQILNSTRQPPHEIYSHRNPPDTHWQHDFQQTACLREISRSFEPVPEQIVEETPLDPFA